MKAETKALIVLMVLVLSAGPITYFFNKEPDQIDLDDTNGTPQFISGSSFITWIIDSIQPTISYIGVSDYNNENLVRQRLDSIKEIKNYTLDIKLSTQGSGYQYIINVPLDEDSNRMLIGFKMTYWLSDFFNPQYSLAPLSGGTMSLPPTIKINTGDDEVEVNTKEDQRLTVYLYYWQEEGNPVTVSCPDLIASQLGNLLKINQICTDVTSVSLYGLTELDFNDNKKSLHKTMKVTIKQFSEVQFKGKVTGNVSQQTIKEALSEKFDENEIVVQLTESEFLLSVSYRDKETSYFVAEKLRDIADLSLEDQINFAIVEMPYSVTIDGKEYDLTIARNAYITTPLSTELGTITADLTFYAVFGDVVGMEGEKV